MPCYVYMKKFKPVDFFDFSRENRAVPLLDATPALPLTHSNAFCPLFVLFSDVKVPSNY